MTMSHFLYKLSLSLHLFFFFFFVSMAAQSNITHPYCLSYNRTHLTITYPICSYQGYGINRSTINQQDCPIIAAEIHTADAYALGSWLSHPSSYNYNDKARIVNLGFHFNCSGVPDFAIAIPCLDFSGRKSSVSFLNWEAEQFDWDGYGCDEEVVTSVLDSNRLGMDFGIELSRLEVRWQGREGCGKCQNGQCSGNSSGGFLCFYCNKSKGPTVGGTMKKFIGIGYVLLSFTLIFIICYIMKPSYEKCVAIFKHKTEDDENIEAFVMQYGSLSLKRYKYADIKKMTNTFQVKLGQGGFGTVFKGKLLDGRLVAVKLLNSSKTSGQEFINEVASISRTSHVNIVTLLGFCFDYKKRALVYEFMSNGSLEKFICGHVLLNKSVHMGVCKFYEVAVGIARGLDYLYRGCNTRILHLDIKPHNILLNEDFCPKIADFGLARLYSRKESNVSILEPRGTIGYIAPEVFNRNFGRVSHKSDVYSYGMLILEMVGGWKNVHSYVDFGHVSELHFPDWIYNRINMDEFLLDAITTKEENDCAKKMAIVGLWCIQSNPMQRPSIVEVIKMLEGSTEALRIPPKPFFCSSPGSLIITCNTTKSDPGSS